MPPTPPPPSQRSALPVVDRRRPWHVLMVWGVTALAEVVLHHYLSKPLWADSPWPIYIAVALPALLATWHALRPRRPDSDRRRAERRKRDRRG